ncbi:DUF645 family protein [Vibrio cholerae]|nr:DUF645 family protein [Vibrio cholerae]
MDVQYSKSGFTKSCIIAVILHSLSLTLNRGQLSLDRFEFWQPISQLWRWMCVCLMLLRKMFFKQKC